MPDACIGVDVIVGFPGETDAHFENTYSFLHELPVSYLHVFTYSERANTTALRIEEVVPMEIRQERNKRLRILSNKKRCAFYESQLGSTRKVLFEASEHEGIMHGFTENYVKVEQPFNAELINQVRYVRLERISPDGNVQIALAEEAAR
jgi:threonylcarbamoyladenosine tRNA methylthiotransferase MtaB